MEEKIKDGKDKINWEKWMRCGEYRIESIKGEEFIRPIPDTGYIFYNISDVQRTKGSRKADENYLVQYLLGLDVSNNQAILEFVNRFGLLGLLQHKYLEPQSIIIDGVERYFVPERDGDTLHEVDEIAQNYLLDLDQYLHEGYYKVLRTMSEPLNEFKKEVIEFQQIARFVSAIKKANEGISGPLRALCKQNVNFKNSADKDIKWLIPMANTYVHIFLPTWNRGVNRRIIPGGNGNWQILWGFDSLLSATHFFYTQDLAGNYWLGECPRCAKLFLSSVGGQIYCSRKCEDAARKADARKKAKEEG